MLRRSEKKFKRFCRPREKLSKHELYLVLCVKSQLCWIFGRDRSNHVPVNLFRSLNLRMREGSKGLASCSLEKMANWAFWAALELVFITSCTAFPTEGPHIDLTPYFSFSASSTCGDPPTMFEHPINSGILQACAAGDHSEELALDGDANTRWQSQVGEMNASVTFSLNRVSKRGWGCLRKIIANLHHFFSPLWH